jgi:hypothetical protein
MIDDTTLNICQRALGDIGTRSTITSVFPVDGSPESFYCNLYYEGVRDQILRAANWNFCKRSALLQLWKALPGTPENPTPATQSGWLPGYPASPWVYSYIYPPDCLRARNLVGQPQQVPIVPPIFSGSQGTNPPISQRLPMARFEVASDLFDQAGTAVGLTQGLVLVVGVTNGTGYVPGDFVTLAGGVFGVPAVLQVLQTGPSGAATAVSVVRRGTYTTVPSNPVAQASTTGSGIGLTLTMSSTANPAQQEVILTQQEFALLDYTFRGSLESIWDSMFVESIIAAMAGRLCQALTGDKTLARDKFTLANAIITNARAIDGNEGLTIIDHVPDWIRTRGVGGGLGYEMFFYPLGPLFPVAPLV